MAMGVIMMDYGYWRSFIPHGTFKSLVVDDTTYVPVPDGGDRPDIIDERYIEAYKIMGNRPFLLMIVRESHLTPERAVELAKKYIESKGE